MSDTYARRTLNNTVIYLAALALGWWGQGMLESDHARDGLLLYAAAVALFVYARFGSRVPAEVPSRPPECLRPSMPSGRRGAAFLAMAVLALAFSMASLRLFVSESLRTGWTLYAVSLVAAVAMLAAAWGGSRSGPRVSYRGWLMLAGILLVALSMRLYRFGDVPFGTWYDEAEAGLRARMMLENPGFRPVLWLPINISGQYLYVFMLAIRLMGDGILSMRAVTVMFGAAGVIAAFLFGRELEGENFGLLLAFLVATCRWHVNFSRIAMTGVDAPFFEFMTLFFVARALRRGDISSWGWAGLTVGMGLCFYSAFRLFAAGLAVFLLIELAVSAAKGKPARNTGARADRMAWAGAFFLFAVSAWIACMPIAQLSWRDGDDFWYRARAVSIFRKRDEPDLLKALANTTQKHLLMFNYKGDKNGRHNLPGAPTLDRISAVFFVMGLAVSLVRWRSVASRLFLLLFITGLLGGILTLDFEAPQSLRSIGAMPSVLFFVALGTWAAWGEARWSMKDAPPMLLRLGAAGVALGVLGLNWHTYFALQANDFAVWSAFSTAETIAGKRMAELGPDVTYYLSPFLENHPSINFWAPDEKERHTIQLMDALPVREPPSGRVALFIHPDDVWVYHLARTLYPGGDFSALGFGGGGDPVLYAVTLDGSDVGSLQGLLARYWNNAGCEGRPVEGVRLKIPSASWPADVPFAAGDSDSEELFCAEWGGVLYAPLYGKYSFYVHAPSSYSLQIDGWEVEDGEEVTLALGNHALRLKARGGSGTISLRWKTPETRDGDASLIPPYYLYAPPITNHGLLARLYNGPSWEGEPALERVDDFLDTYFHLPPLPRPYSVEWTGVVVAPVDGVYSFGLLSVDDSSLFIDGEPVVSNVLPGAYAEGVLMLQAGRHEIRVAYRDLTARSRIHLYWTRPDGGNTREIIPSLYLWPPMGDYSAVSELEEDYLSLPKQGGEELMDLSPVAMWGGMGSEPGRFIEPRDAAIDSGGHVYVVDGGNRRVQVFGPDGDYISSWEPGDDEPLEEPVAIVINGRDEAFVLDSAGGWIHHLLLDAAEGVVAGYGGRLGGPAVLNTFHPRGLSLVDDDTLAVVDTGNSKLIFVGVDGTVENVMGSRGDMPGEFAEPTDVLRMPDGTYFVTEAYNARAQRVDVTGASLLTWPIEFSYALDGTHLDLAPDGTLLLTYPPEGAVYRFTPDGRAIGVWFDFLGERLGQPVGIAVSPDGSRLYVTDTGQHRVYCWEINKTGKVEMKGTDDE